MFFKSAAVACSLAALLVVGCDTDDNDVEDRDVIVTPGDDATPGTTPDPTINQDIDIDSTPPADPDATSVDEPLTPGASPSTLDDDSIDTDEPVVEEVEAGSLPEVEDEE